MFHPINPIWPQLNYSAKIYALRLYTQYFVLTVNACNLYLNLVDEIIVWHGLHLSIAEEAWHMNFLTHNCMFGLAQVWVWLALLTLNTIYSALLMFGWSLLLKYYIYERYFVSLTS